MRTVRALFAREVRLAFAGGGGPAGPAAFFLAALTLAPLAIGPGGPVLAAAGPGVIAFAALLAVLQGAERVFGDDLADGTLDVYLVSGLDVSVIAAVKTLAAGLATLWPLPVIGVLGGVAYGLPVPAALMLGAALAVSLPGLSFIAGLAGALAAGVKRAGILVALIAAPLMIPILVFAAASGRAAFEGDDRALASAMIAAALSLGISALAPFAIGAVLRARSE
ncbi:MAG: cytochrome C biogenesis protein [Maricaulis sp.]|jgi:heme exporter protein B|nr:cytochrome C biogenesis protein [Maricaulis sp.]